MECEKCLNEQRIIALEQDKERNSEQHKEFYGQLKDIAVSEGRKEERENSRDLRMSNLVQMVTDVQLAIKEIQNRPLKDVDKVRDKVIGKAVDFIIIAIVGYLLYVLK